MYFLVLLLYTLTIPSKVHYVPFVIELDITIIVLVVYLSYLKLIIFEKNLLKKELHINKCPKFVNIV